MMNSDGPEIIGCRDIDDISAKAAIAVVEIASRAIAEEGTFTIALSGGSTPLALYTRLSTDEYKKRIDWTRTHVFWGDERCVPPDSGESNYKAALETLLSRIEISESRIHRIKGELGEAAAPDYEITIKKVFGIKERELPRFNLILLGMGSDGHMASLFPWTSALSEDKSAVASVHIEKLGSNRITLTHPVINNAKNVILLVSGKNKATALKNVLEGDFDPQRYPAQLLRLAKGNVKWFVDNPALSLPSSR